MTRIRTHGTGAGGTTASIDYTDVEEKTWRVTANSAISLGGLVTATLLTGIRLLAENESFLLTEASENIIKDY